MLLFPNEVSWTCKSMTFVYRPHIVKDGNNKKRLMNITTSLNGAKENHVFSVISAQMVFLISYCVYNITQYPCSLGIITLNKGLWLRCPYFFGFCMCVCVYACKHTLVHSWIYQIYQKKNLFNGLQWHEHGEVIRSNLGFRVLPKDMWTCGAGDQTTHFTCWADP